MEAFTRLVDYVVEYESEFSAASKDISKNALVMQQDELREMWCKAKAAHDDLNSKGDMSAKDYALIKKKFKLGGQCYIRCMGAMKDMSEILSTPKDTEKSAEVDNNHSLPPCDTDVFKGDYLSWPTFRDMFTAVYIKSKRLSPVEKLYHLNKKTQGEAKVIVSKCPLTNDGFAMAWKGLTDMYENERILVETQVDILLDLPSIDKECSSSIKWLQREINSCISCLTANKVDIGNWDPIIIRICSKRLPQATLALWEQSVKNKTKTSKWEELDNFLTDRYRDLEAIERAKKSSNSVKPVSAPTQNKYNNNSHQNRLGAFQVSVEKSTCLMCKSADHKLRSCPMFLNMAPADRIKFAKRNNRCINCLGFGHLVSQCTSAFNCSTCHARHHTLLHVRTVQPSSQRGSSTPSDEIPSTSRQAQQKRNFNESKGKPTTQVQSCFANSDKGVLLGTAQISINYSGVTYAARALIDSGSECSFITERLKRRINLPVRKINAQVSGINNTVSAQVKESCCVELRSPIDPLISITTNMMVLPKLTGNLPTCHISALTRQAFPDLTLADKRFFVNEPVDVILGGDVYPQIMLDGIRKNLASFWELEEISKEKKLSEEDRYCEELYKETTKRNEDGKYVVSLPFRKDYPVNISLGSSLKIAYSQFYRNEARLSRDENLQKEYNRVLNEYVELGHMAKIHTNQTADSSNNYYLPHHAVKKEESTSTKVRVVFNASQASSNGTSLNDILLPGPVLQADLTILILRWRLFKYVFNSDIEKMYRQILLKADQTKYQRIVFRNHPTEQTNLFELKTVTFGINCAPYLAIRTLLQLADDVESSLPVASNILRKCMYVDDVLAGGHSVEAAIKARNEIKTALESAGFPLRKWTANCGRILQGLPKDHLLNKEFLDFEDTSDVKALGIRWNAHTDFFYFKTKPILSPESYTKRAILSDIAKLFDPLGWLAPIIVTAKMIMQHIWLEGTQWDEFVSPTTLDRWHTFMDNHRYINNIKIPRWVHFSPTDDVSIHGFCDASEKAYAATVYLRVRTSNEVFVSLLLAKTRVAPVKTISLPRLELCGAVLLAETVESVVNNLELTHLKLKLWTDSTIVLAWIRKPPCSWSTFVSHRVTKIIEKVGNANWNHVDSGSNPADLASRGLMAQDLVENTLWWQGPSWLQEDQSKWPLRQNDYETTIEEKQSCLISSEEIKATTKRLIINTQKQKYGQEYGCLKSGKPIDAKSEILSLNPFLDKDEVLRTGGRLAPHMGGLWEAGVKSFKSHFRKIASGQKYTLEEFNTLLCRIESCLNSRPLSPASNEPTDLEPLTPGHFLVGGHLMAPPEPDINESSASIVNRWQKLKALHQSFCKRWKTEYLNEMQKRIKWKHSKTNLKTGDLVVIKEDNLSPNEWRLGRIVNIHPGADTRVRVVDIITEKGQVTRPLAKLVLLPPYEEENEDAHPTQHNSSLATSKA
ncbi:uncharacterized protein LOC126764636 [Bactrocera neohumeralis]|uniref:uncharacterized protein LOC126764636 n=1 Tax=Bactrocera neohumeralis TaxID=98809 RepID=UPI002166BC69|nr:uncharacterized protein LOC126764636 [Bactrocera neohumeralis]